VKVLHLINTLSAGGAELHLLTLCRHTKQLGVETAVVFLRERVTGSRTLRHDFEKDNIRLIDLRADSRYDWRFLGRLINVLKCERPNILHTHLPRADLAGAIVSRLTRSPAFVCSVHGIYRDRWFGSWAAPFMGGAYRQADGVIAISSAVKGWVHQDLGVSGNKIKVIHYGIEANRFDYSTFDQAENGGRGRRLTIGSIGRLEQGKGFDCLINAMGNLCQHLPNATLSIAGHDPLGYGKTLEELIARLKLQEQVELVGFQSDIASFLHGLDVFAFASRSEGFGQVVIEAMAARTPVIASKIPPLTEIVVDGETGLLVEPDNPQAFADAFSRLLSHPEEQRRFGELGQERVRRHFSAEKMTDATLYFYEEVLRRTSALQVSAS
jgi:glycosyltransferase involved in cell wall biosynthesis